MEVTAEVAENLLAAEEENQLEVVEGALRGD